MPANEQTWRDSKLLHLVFGISGLAMLATTVWMLAADHRREWKDYVRKFRDIETWTADARLAQQGTEDYYRDLKKARDQLDATLAAVPDGNLLDQFIDAVNADAENHKEKVNLKPLGDEYEALKRADEARRPELREKFRNELNKFVGKAKFREENLASQKKFRSAELDVLRSEYELGVGNELPKKDLEDKEEQVHTAMDHVDAAVVAVQNAKSHRLQLEGLVAQMFADETDARKTLDELADKRTQLEKARYERANNFTRDLVGLPILDAFGGTKVDQIWLPKLTIYNNFSDVARFDRCTNCHLGMDKTAAGSAIEPLYDKRHPVNLTMATPAEEPQAPPAESKSIESDEARYNRIIQEAYGLQLSPEGLFDKSEAMVSVVVPESLAAKAQLEVGDVIAVVNDVKILDKKNIYGALVENVNWGQPLKLTVRRGFPQPYSSHPRLDLFVGSLSPHKMADVGCTICHDGQGSGTAFKWASHSPNDPDQGGRWKRDYGWFDNHHWIFPMYPKRFAESLCLKCHHEVTELEPSERFPDPPAPKLMEGFRLIQQVGCFGCHEINGYDGPNKRIGPDLRTEPNYAAAAEAMLNAGLEGQQKTWAEDIVREPSDDAARHSLSQSLKNSETLPGDAAAIKRLVSLLDDVEAPGKYRKVGPSLRHVASKVNFDFLYSWVRKPTDFRPSTKMPQFFLQYGHLDGVGLKEAERYEPIEIRGISEYLLAKSQPFEYTPPPKNVTTQPSAERGKFAFEIRCLACHQHSDFPAGKMEQGPDLSRIGAKLTVGGNTNGPKWLYTWLRNPSKYHARTFMPNMILDPIPGPDGKLTDPAADITAFLLGSKQDWKPTDVPSKQLAGKEEEKSLHDLALLNLKTVTSERQAEAYLKNGIPEDRRGEFKGDEVELVGPMSVEKQLRYVGRRAISKYGCSGCHDVPGFEDAKPIGTGLADWARKTPDKLAFEQIVEYMKHGHGAPGVLVHEIGHEANVSDKQIEEAVEGQYGHEQFNVENLPLGARYFEEKLDGHQREGFIWQKLREPRSYDYKKTENKTYNERLRMPMFTVLDDAKREAIITFVLGLVAEPPASQYVYKGTPRSNAISQGKAVIEKFNCTGCHTLEMDRWQLAFDPADFKTPASTPDYPFLEPHFSPQQVAASKTPDTRGLMHAKITGMPAVDDQGRVIRLDEDGGPLEPDDKTTKAFYSFALWDNVLINGDAWSSGLQPLLVPETAIEKRYAPVGGYLPRLAYASVVTEERKINSQAKPEEAWGWLPPPLFHEGRKVQTAWLHDFLLDPQPIRPAVLLRMPRFNMSPAEATKLVNYFAAVDGVDYPYNFDPRTRGSHLAAEDAQHPHRLTDALKIVTDNNFCVKCHLLGDFSPMGSERAKAPRLDAVYKRLRPDFTLDWIGRPKRILPYTAMPDNIPYDKPVSQSLYKGSSEQQLSAIVDLLLNYDRYLEDQNPPKIKAAPPAAAGEPSGAKTPDAAQ